MWRRVSAWQDPRRKVREPGWPSESTSPNLTDRCSLCRSRRHPSSAVSISDTTGTTEAATDGTGNTRLFGPKMFWLDIWFIYFLYLFNILRFYSLTTSPSSPASWTPRNPEEESPPRFSERRRGGFYHWKKLPQRNQSHISGEHCRY